MTRQSSIFWVLLFLMCVDSSKSPPSAVLSDFASSGEVKMYLGAVDRLPDLISAVEACSYKKEIIVISATDTFVDAAAQTVSMLGRFGIRHVIIASVSETACGKIALLIPGVCCVWTTLVTPQNELGKHGFSHHRFLMEMRLMIAARTLRLGYNILFLDTDLIIFDDPYRYLKSPPFSEMNVVMSGGVGDVNIGVMYVQNVAPDGPVAWMFAEVPDRLLRWSENPDFIMKKQFPKLTNFQHMMWDQANFGDVLLSAASGRPVFQGAWAFHNGEFNRTWQEHHFQTLVSGRTRTLEVPSPPLYQRISKQVQGQARLSLSYVDLTRPFTGGQWPEDLGGQPFPEKRGEFSERWQQQLRESGAPMWPAPDDPACHGEPPLERAGRRRVAATTSQLTSRDLYPTTESQHLTREHAADGAPSPPCWMLPWLDAVESGVSEQQLGLLRPWSCLTTPRSSRVTQGRADGMLHHQGLNAPTAAAEERLGGREGAEGSAPPARSSDTLVLGARATARTLSAGSCPGRGKPERVGFLPVWFSNMWSYMEAASQDWDCTVYPPTQVIGHVLFLVNDKRIYKNAIKQTYGWYNWTVAQQSREQQVFFASTAAVAVPKVLSASEKLQEKMARMDIIQFLTTLRALFSAALTSGRAFAWPAVPCGPLKRIVHEIRKKPTLKRNHDRYYMTSVVPYPLERNHSCIWSDYMFGNCLDNGQGLLPPEFLYLLSTLPNDGGRQQPGNTLKLQAPSQLSEAEVIKHGSVSQEVFATWCQNVSLARFVEVAKQLEHEAVVYMDEVPLIEGIMRDRELKSRLEGPLNYCWALTLY